MANDEIVFEDMWYASTKKAKSRSKKIVYDSKYGVLTINNKTNTFSYISDDVVIENVEIKAIAPKRQSFHYLTYLGLALPLIIFYFLKQDLAYGVVGVLIGAVLGSSIWYSMRWIVIEYETKGGSLDWAWFYDGRYRGWGGFRGTMQKFKKIKRFLGVN